MASSEYDYRTSSIDEDRSRAQEVYERVERQVRDKRANSNGRAHAEGQEGASEEGDARQADAIRRIQGGYR